MPRGHGDIQGTWPCPGDTAAFAAAAGEAGAGATSKAIPGTAPPSRPNVAAQVTGRAQVHLFIRSRHGKLQAAATLYFLKNIYGSAKVWRETRLRSA